MSGHKRALVGLDARLAARLAELEGQMGAVQTNYQSVSARIAAMQAEEQARAETSLAARQQAMSETLLGVEDRFQALEARTRAALAWQTSRHARDTAAREQRAARRSLGLENRLEQAQATLAAMAYDLDRQRSLVQDQQLNAWQTLQAARTLEEGLCAYYPANLWSAPHGRIAAWLEQADRHLQDGQSESALLSAQQAYLDLQGLRLDMEAHFQRQHRLRMAVMQRLNEVIALAEGNTAAPAVDLDGQFLDTWIDVNQWSGGLLGRTHARAAALLAQVAHPAAAAPEPDWRELLDEQIPRLEQAVSEAVSLARRAVLSSQLRFNVAERVVQALSEQGYALAASGWEDSAAEGYQAALQDYSGSQVLVRVAPAPQAAHAAETDPAYQLDVTYHSQAALSDHILRRSAAEIFGALRSAGLTVAPLQADSPAEPTRQSAPQRRPAFQSLET